MRHRVANLSEVDRSQGSGRSRHGLAGTKCHRFPNLSTDAIWERSDLKTIPLAQRCQGTTELKLEIASIPHNSEGDIQKINSPERETSLEVAAILNGQDKQSKKQANQNAVNQKIK